MNLNSILEKVSETASSALSNMPSMSTELFAGAFNDQPHGLHNFIKEIRDTKNKDEERSRVDKELGKIRQKFSNPSNLNAYQKKKAVWKMCYIYMLGYEVEFGHIEFISLLSSTKVQEKAVGYMAVALFLKPGDDLMTLVVNSIRNDIIGRNNFAQSLALSAVSNIGGTDLAESLVVDVEKLVVPPSDTNFTPQITNHNNGGSLTAAQLLLEVEARGRNSVCKKSILCLMRLFRTNPDCLSLTPEWVGKINKLISDRDVGVVTSAMSLVLSLVQANLQNALLLAPLLPSVVSILSKLTVSRACPDGYMYHTNACPWLQVKCLKFLQRYDYPDNNSSSNVREVLNDALIHVLTRTEHSDSVNKTNADFSVLYEVINLIITYGNDAGENLRRPAFNFIGKFVSTPEPNIRYIGLDLMNNVLKHEGPDEVKIYKSNVLDSLKDLDVSVRKRALENIFSLTDRSNSREVIEELLTILTTTDPVVKEDFVVVNERAEDVVILDFPESEVFIFRGPLHYSVNAIYLFALGAKRIHSRQRQTHIIQ